MNTMKINKLIFGVCGIGRGHIYRQLPLISHFAHNSRIVIFAFGESFVFFKSYFKNNTNIKVILVAVPWIHGGPVGINYIKTANEKSNKGVNFTLQNFSAMDQAYKFLSGKPDLVVSDYEPISAQYSYSLNVPLVTIDQQSKYFYDGYPTQLGNLGFIEERARLSLFFPKAEMRIACSFFKPPSDKITYGGFEVKLVPVMIRDEITKLKTNNQEISKNVLIYLSPYSSFVQDAKKVIEILFKFSDYSFHLYVSKKSDFSKIKKQLPKNIKISFHGDKGFSRILSLSSSVICTAGHMFLSEMMFLGKPVYAIPLQTYEQKYNAKIIEDNGFGIMRPQIDSNSLGKFLASIIKFKHNIISDKKVLLNEGSGQAQIVNLLKKMLK
jgi:uncharacterized protein (TIGR00661 family)